MKRWKKWELTLLLGLCAALIWGAWSAQRQDALARKMIRLHVIANSDSAEDQALKLEVRDKVLNFTTNVLQRSVDMEDAQMQLQDALDRIENIAQREIVNQGYDYPVTAQLTRTEFPPEGVRRFFPARRGVHGPAAGDRRRGGAELVVRGISTPVYRRGHGHAGDGYPGGPVRR